MPRAACLSAHAGQGKTEGWEVRTCLAAGRTGRFTKFRGGPIRPQTHRSDRCPFECASLRSLIISRSEVRFTAFLNSSSGNCVQGQEFSECLGAAFAVSLGQQEFAFGTLCHFVDQGKQHGDIGRLIRRPAKSDGVGGCGLLPALPAHVGSEVVQETPPRDDPQERVQSRPGRIESFGRGQIEHDGIFGGVVDGVLVVVSMESSA